MRPCWPSRLADVCLHLCRKNAITICLSSLLVEFAKGYMSAWKVPLFRVVAVGGGMVITY